MIVSGELYRLQIYSCVMTELFDSTIRAFSIGFYIFCFFEWAFHSWHFNCVSTVVCITFSVHQANSWSCNSFKWRGSLLWSSSGLHIELAADIACLLIEKGLMKTFLSDIEMLTHKVFDAEHSQEGAEDTNFDQIY